MKFSRSSRLASKSDFKFVFDAPLKISRKNLKILYRHNAHSHPRLGIIVAKHIMPLAVDRNRFRRIIRESFRQYQAVLQHVDIVVIIRNSVAQMDAKTIRRDIDEVWTSIIAGV